MAQFVGTTHDRLAVRRTEIAATRFQATRHLQLAFKRSAAAMKPHGPRGVLTLILAVAVVGEPFRVAVISNARWGEHPPRAKNHFDIAIHTIKKPFQLVSGFRELRTPT